MMKRILKKMLLVFFGIFIALLILEIVLRIWHPFAFTVKGDKIILAANIHVKMKNTWIAKLDDTIYYSRNSLGLRGAELPKDPGNILKLITVGGSTTECKFLSDQFTWSEQLKLQLDKRNFWINNAGIDGHSTFGNIVMMKDYIVKLHPQYVLFLTGINDIELDRSGPLDDQDIQGIHGHSVKYFFKSIINYSEVGSLMISLYRNYLAYRKGLVHGEVDLKKLPVEPTDSIIKQNRLSAQTKYLSSYAQRLGVLEKICHDAGIIPVFITQPALYGNVVDSTTNVFMGNRRLSEVDCATGWQILELYNNEIRKLRGREIIIDLASAMPKDSKYYYDFIHYTNEGAAKVGKIIADSLKLILR